MKRDEFLNQFDHVISSIKIQKTWMRQEVVGFPENNLREEFTAHPEYDTPIYASIVVCDGEKFLLIEESDKEDDGKILQAHRTRDMAIDSGPTIAYSCRSCRWTQASIEGNCPNCGSFVRKVPLKAFKNGKLEEK